MKESQACLEFPADLVCTVTRHKRGRGFEYFDKDKQKIKDKNVLSHIRSLTIPPMWDQVQVSENLNSHIQAIGFDKKGRKQYIYHPQWHLARQDEKFAKLEQFANALPTIRSQYNLDAEATDWSVKHVSAIATRILDSTGMRIGHKSYSQQNKTYGLSTIRERHIERDENKIIFEFQGKHNKQRQVMIDDPELIALIEKCSDKPGYTLLRYRDGSRWIDVSSDDINDYIRSISSDQFSSKYFRTWVGTRLAVELYKDCKAHVDENPRRQFKPTLIKAVANILGNTPSVCETYYIHPKVLTHLVMFSKQGKTDALKSHFNISRTEEYTSAEQIALQIISGQ